MYAGRPSVCRNCGALVGAGERECAVCGSPAGAGAQAQEQPPPGQVVADPETIRFARAVLTRPSIFTFVFLAINVFIFLLMTSAAPGGSENTGVLLAYGAKQNWLINERGEWWRFVTPVFLHIGWLHLLVNMYSLFILGPYVEKLYGAARFVFFWIATGVAGVVASYLASGAEMHNVPVLGRFLFRGGDAVSAGASGALFGLIGVLFVFGIKFRRELPEGFKRAFGTGMIPTILINLFIGYTIPFIDNAAHLGGFVAGAIFALFVGYKRPGQRASVAVFWHVLQIASLVLVVVSFGEVVRNMGEARSQVSYVDGINAGQGAFAAAFNDRDANAAGRAIEQLDKVAPLGEQPDRIRLELRQLLVRAQALALLGDEERKAENVQQQLAQLAADFETWEKYSDNWVKTEGGNFGFVLEEENNEAAPAAPPGTAAPAPAASAPPAPAASATPAPAEK
jgi:membrane associated rhomboid family serine protease